MKEKIIAEIDKYLENCRIARENGAMSEFGSAGGAMMLSGTKQAFEDLRKFVESL